MLALDLNVLVKLEQRINYIRNKELDKLQKEGLSEGLVKLSIYIPVKYVLPFQGLAKR